MSLTTLLTTLMTGIDTALVLSIFKFQSHYIGAWSRTEHSDENLGILSATVSGTCG